MNTNRSDVKIFFIIVKGDLKHYKENTIDNNDTITESKINSLYSVKVASPVCKYELESIMSSLLQKTPVQESGLKDKRLIKTLPGASNFVDNEVATLNVVNDDVEILDIDFKNAA